MKILPSAVKIAQKAGELILKSSQKKFKISFKGKNDLVTEIDLATEKFIIKEIKKLFPDHGILGEEMAFKAKNGIQIKDFNNCKYIWIIDPIDGTTNFSHGNPYYAISIGVFKTKVAQKSKNFEYLEGELIAGVVYAPTLKELYYAEKDKGAYLNGKKIHVSKINKLEKALLATDMGHSKKDTNIKYIAEILEKCQGIRRFGAASLDLCAVARGTIDAYWELNLKPWDMAAGILIIAEAGGKVTDISGNTLDLFGKQALTSNKKLHPEILKTFNVLD